MTMSQRDVFLAAAESVQQRGLCKCNYYDDGTGAACVIGHLALALQRTGIPRRDRRAGRCAETVRDYVLALTGKGEITTWNDDHASAEDVILMFKTLAEEAES